MTAHSAPWASTTHDWAVAVDRSHLEAIRGDPDAYAPGGVLQLVLEVLAYANDEAEALGRPGRALVTLHADGSVSVQDDGRGTDTRCDDDGNTIKKPVMATKDLRFFDPQHDMLLPDGSHRRGMSVVAALSRWLIHTNRRHGGAWTQRYEHGLPTSALIPIDTVNGTGTTVHFLADTGLESEAMATPDEVRLTADFPWLSVEVRSE